MDSYDSNLVRGLMLILMIFAFLGIWAWAWSRNRKASFRDASMLPLEEDDGQVPPDSTHEERKED